VISHKGRATKSGGALHFGLADAELQRITGHARQETLAVSQHVALDGDLEQKYQGAMKKVDLGADP
jgi:integrase/recombinase XerD